MPSLAADDLPHYRRAIARAVRAWGLLTGHVRVRLTAALRRAHGTNLRDGFEGGPDIPRSFPEACANFRQALSALHAFEDHPPEFPWPPWGDRVLSQGDPLPDIDRWIASLDGMSEDEWRSRVIEPFRQNEGAVSLYLQEFMARFERAREAAVAAAENKPATLLRIDKAITRGLTEEHEREEADRADPRMRLHQLLTVALNGMGTLNESGEAWAERVTARLASVGHEIVAQGWEEWAVEGAGGEPVLRGLIDLMLQGDRAGINAVVLELRDNAHEFGLLGDWLRSRQRDWSSVFERGWLWWKFTKGLPLSQPQTVHPAPKQQEAQAPANVSEVERPGTMSCVSVTTGSVGRRRGTQEQERREMAWDETLNDLRQVLAELYHGPAETRVLLETAGVPTGKVLLEAAPQLRWHNALREASLQGKVEALLSTAQAEYGNHAGLQAAATTYLAKHRPDLTPARDGAAAESEGTVLLDEKGSARPAKCDLAIVTAMPDELDPVFRLTGGKGSWQAFAIDRFVHYYKKLEFQGQEIDVVAVSLWRYGDTPTAGAVHRLKPLCPRMLSMTGICAGWEGKDGIEFGDVIIGEGGFNPREGKQQGTKFQPDTHLQMSPPWVVQQAKDSLGDEGWIGEIETERPRSLRYQGEWLLCQVREAGFRLSAPDWDRVQAEKIEYAEALDWLRRHEFLDEAGAITSAGRALLERRRAEGRGACKPRTDRDKPKAHVGTFASDAPVIAVEAPFKQPAAQVRSTRAYDLEVKTFLQAAAELAIPAVAVKGVSDYGTTEKDDHYRHYAADAAACWLLAFVRKYSRFWAEESAR
jgi:nucleoside phosphorylase